MGEVTNDKLRLAILAALSMASAAPLYAQSASTTTDTSTTPAPDASTEPAGGDGVGLDEIVVTAAAGDKSRLRSSISVTQIDTQAIQEFTPRSEGAVLRMIPGIQINDTAGPGGNSNIGVRGIPVSTGGSEYVQLQEDGLPVTLFGDMQFGNNDYWIRFDQNVERVEAVRGGSASTFASQAPGAIINYVSKTGETEGGSILLTRGANYNETRLDFDYGEHISDTVRFHVGGFFKDGGGPENLGYDASQGYQLKGNITKDLDDGKGFIRLNFKRLDDQEPTNTSMPTLATINAGTITGLSVLPGLDARNYSSAGIYNQQFTVLNQNGTQQLVKDEGIHPIATAVGGQFHYDFDHNITVNDSFRYTVQSGVFANQWTTEGLTSGVTSVNGIPVGSILYTAGPLKGQEYTSPFINNGAQTYVTMRDMGSTVNDLSFTSKYDWTDDIGSSAKLGWFHDRQAIAADWRINNEFTSLNTTQNSVPLDVFGVPGANGTAAQLTANGLTGYNNQWGGCCGGRSYDLSYTDDAIYLDFDTKVGKLDLDPSIRYDTVRGQGNSYAPVAGADVTVADALTPAGSVGATIPTYNTATSPTDTLNYTKSYTSWSFGALYSIDNDTSVFARASRGGRFNADRMLYSGDFNANGSLDAHGEAVALNFLNQQELGVKDRGSFGDVRYTAEATLFHTTLTEHNYDFTLLSKNPPEDPNISAQYRGEGLEFTGQLNYLGGFLVTDITYANSKITANPGDPQSVGQEPQGLPSLLYRISAGYDRGLFALGTNITGHNISYTTNDNTLSVPGSALVSVFGIYRPFDKLEVGVNVSNLLNKLGNAGGGGIQANVSPTLGILDNSAYYGRLIDVSVRYKF
jgi:outer membrane receptor protein involved in Fe transport